MRRNYYEPCLFDDFRCDDTLSEDEYAMAGIL